MKHLVLFVDDEPLILQGLQRMLRRMGQDWEMEFVSSGALALERMAQRPFDAVVTDMRMPCMDGAELLKQVIMLSPRTVRLILSGQADEQLIMKCVGVAHQYLAKPCDPETLRAALNRAFTAGTSLNNPRLKELVCQLHRLPSLPSLYVRLVKLLQDPEVDLSQVARTVASDLAMTAKVLKLVNSAYFGLGREVVNVGEAVAYLGISTLKTLVLAIHAFAQFEGDKNAGLRLDQLWAHSLEVAATARRIAQIEQASSAVVEQAFVGGLLHDTGQLILGANLRGHYAALMAAAEAAGEPLQELETAELGTTHAEVGGYLLGLWGLPVPVVEAIALHHQPRLCSNTEFCAVAAVHVAEAFHPPSPRPGTATGALAPDLEYLANLGLSERLRLWNDSIAERVLAPA